MPDPSPPSEEQARPRHDTWGGPEARQALRRIADDVRERAGFKVCAIEVLRDDDMLEFVAIAGSPEGEKELLGNASPLNVMGVAFSLGAEYGAFTFVAEEWFTRDAAERMTAYGWVPDLDDTGDPDQWRPMDMLVARIVSERGDLRALLYLDEPLTGRRLTPGRLHELAETMALPLRAVLTTIEREELSQQVRLASTAREVVRAASSRLDYRELLAQTREHLVEGFRADDLAVLVPGDPPSLPAGDSPVRLDDELLTAVAAAGRRAWRAQGVVIVEPGRVWGDEQLDEEHRDALTRHLAEKGAGALVVVPLGAGPDPVGVLLLARRVDGVRWTESESSAALDVGHDLGRAILSTRARERELELIEELKRLDEYRSQLISTVSHELQNPLGVILGHVELLESLSGLPDGAQPSLRALGRSAERLSAVVDDLLLLSRMETPDHPLAGDRVDLAPVLAEVAEDLALAADQYGVAVAAPRVEGEVVVAGSRAELARLLANLVSNAVKYSRPGGRVRLRLWRDGDEIVFECRDEGIGISEADQALLFTEFFRSTNPEAVSRPGTGLGLAIVRRIVERHSGRIEVRSRLGEGTTVTVALPAP
jgi:signal transduction histidine kinase